MGSRSTSHETDWAEIDSALLALAADRCESRDTWLAVGMALHSYDSGEESFARWDAWSRGSEKYDARALRSSWNGFKPDRGITIATLFGLAIEDGWRRTDEPIDAQNGQNGGRQRPATAISRPEPTPRAPEDEKPQFWPDLETARRNFEALPRVIDDAGALEYFAAEYGAMEMDLCAGDFAEWRVLQWPGGLGVGEGERVVVYPAVSPTGQPSYKMKTMGRVDAKKDGRTKRASRWLYRTKDATGPAAFHVKRPGAPLVIVGGEEKAVVAYAAGFSVLCGMDGEGNLMRPRETGRDGQPVGDEKPQRWAQWVADADPPAVILALDADEEGEKAASAIARAIADAGYPRLQIRRVVWPEGLPRGWDLNDAKKAGQDLRAVLAEAEGVVADRLTIANLPAIMDFRDDGRDNLLGAYMLFRGSPRCSLMIGPPGVGKSRLSIQMAIDVTCGFDFCGLESHGAGTRWLFFQAENTPRRLKDDLRHMLKGSPDNVRRTVSENLWFLAPTRDSDSFLNFSIPGVAERLVDAVKAYDPDVVVWDPLIEFFAGESENANVDMKACVAQMMKISRARRRDTAVLILAHASPGKAAIAKAYGFDAGHFHRGASSLIGAAGASFNVAPADEDDPSRLILACGKCSDGPRFAPRGLVLDPDRRRYEVDPMFDLQVWKESVGNAPRPKREPAFDETMVFSRIPLGGKVGQKELIDSISEAHNIPAKTVYKWVKKMRDDGSILAEKEGAVTWIMEVE